MYQDGLQRRLDELQEANNQLQEAKDRMSLVANDRLAKLVVAEQRGFELQAKVWELERASYSPTAPSPQPSYHPTSPAPSGRSPSYSPTSPAAPIAPLKQEPA